MLSKILKATSIDHVNMTVKNLEQSVEFYKNWVYEITVTFRDGTLSYKMEYLKMEDKIQRLWEKFSK